MLKSLVRLLTVGFWCVLIVRFAEWLYSAVLATERYRCCVLAVLCTGRPASSRTLLPRVTRLLLIPDVPYFVTGGAALCLHFVAGEPTGRRCA